MVVSGTIEEVKGRVLGGLVLEVEVLGPTDLLERIVAADPLAGPVEPRAGSNGTASVAIPYRGDAAAASALLAALVGGGVPVASFTRRKEGLEELFLKVGATELS